MGSRKPQSHLTVSVLLPVPIQESFLLNLLFLAYKMGIITPYSSHSLWLLFTKVPSVYELVKMVSAALSVSHVLLE